MNTSTSPVGVAIIGMGGFAKAHHGSIAELEKQGHCRLVATCDPSPEVHRELAEKLDFEGRGVRVFRDYREMLDACRGMAEVVTVPTPIPLHAPMHRACVENGFACYLEKPPTLSPNELAEMIQLDASAQRATNVGFNFLIEPQRQALKKRILSGEFGAVKGVDFIGMWPRTHAYYRRASWAGRLILNGNLVLDSCVGNALSHFFHCLFWWAGRDGLHSWDRPRRVRAELYRGHRIQGVDTVFASTETMGGLPIRAAVSHAVIGSVRGSHCETIHCEKAVIEYVTTGNLKVSWTDGRVEEEPVIRLPLVDENIMHYLQFVGGGQEKPMTTLEDSRAFVEFNSLIYLAGGRIHTVAADQRMETEAGEVAIHGVPEAAGRFLKSGEFPSDQGCPWGRPGGEAEIGEIPRLREVVERMASESPLASAA